MSRLTLLLFCGLLMAPGFVVVGDGQETQPRPEVSLSDKEVGRLDIFAERALSEADAVFNLQEYAAARGKYEMFLAKHGDSPAAAYAMLRKGRCAELSGQLADAITDYEALAARFSKSVKYAAPALFYLADCHRKNGNGDEAARAKARLSENKEFADSPFAKQPVASIASPAPSQPPADGGTTTSTTPTVKLTLAEYEQIALAGTDPKDEAVAAAIDNVVRQHVRVAADEAKLREFYRKLHKDAGDKPQETLAYWLWVNEGIQKHSTFSYSEKTQREEFFAYWLGLMKDKYPDSDDCQIAIAQLQYGSDRDRTKFAERMDALFKRTAGDAPAADATKSDWRRTLKWVGAYQGNWSKTREYVAMFNYESGGLEGIHALVNQLCNEQNESYLARSTFKKIAETLPYEKLTNEDIRKLIALAHGTVKDVGTAQLLAGKLDFERMSEQEKLALAREFLAIDGSLARPVYDRLDDQVVGKLVLFKHYVASDDTSRAIVIAGELAKLDGYSEEFSLKKAEMLEAGERYADAITAFQQCGNTPEILWRIVRCHQTLGETDKAIEQLRGIEKADKKQAAKAALTIAALYGEAEEKEKQIAALRYIVKKYPNSKEAKEADGQLGDLGVPPSLPTDTVFDF